MSTPDAGPGEPGLQDVRRLDSTGLAQLDADALLLLLPQRPLPLAGVAGLADFASGGQLSRAYQAGKLRFAVGERALLPAPGGWRLARLLCVGLGEPRALTPGAAATAFTEAVAAAHAAGAARLSVALPALGLSARPRAEAALQASLLRTLAPHGRDAQVTWLR